MKNFQLPTSDPNPLPKPSSPFLDTRPIQLIEVKARGRFGDVWRALFKEEEVAVKVFPVQVRYFESVYSLIQSVPLKPHKSIYVKLYIGKLMSTWLYIVTFLDYVQDYRFHVSCPIPKSKHFRPCKPH